MIVRFFRWIGFCFQYLFVPQPSDELSYVRALLEDEIKSRKELTDSLFVYLRVKPDTPRTYMAGSDLHIGSPVPRFEPVRKGGIQEFRAKQYAAELAQKRKVVDREAVSKNPDLASRISELDADLGILSDDSERPS